VDWDIVPLSSSLIDRARSGQFIALADLLPARKADQTAALSSPGEDEAVLFRLDGKGVSRLSSFEALTHRNQPKKRSIISMEQVAEIIILQLIDIIHRENLDICTQLYSLLGVALGISRQHGWTVAYQYIEAVRQRHALLNSTGDRHQHSSATVSFSMGIFNDQLLSAAIRAESVSSRSSKPPSSSAGSNTSTSSSNSNVNEQICWNYNRKKCVFKGCKRRHVCEICESPEHTAKSCPSAPAQSATKAALPATTNVGRGARTKESRDQ
jgi:hypothetical protein